MTYSSFDPDFECIDQGFAENAFQTCHRIRANKPTLFSFCKREVEHFTPYRKKGTIQKLYRLEGDNISSIPFLLKWGFKILDN